MAENLTQEISKFDNRAKSSGILRNTRYSLPPSEKFKDIVDRLERVRAPSVPDFGFHAYDLNSAQNKQTHWGNLFNNVIKQHKYERVQNFINFRLDEKQKET